MRPRYRCEGARSRGCTRRGRCEGMDERGAAGPASLAEEPPAPEVRGVGQAELAQGDLGHRADRVARRVGDEDALDVLRRAGPFGDEAALEEVEEGPPEGVADQDERELLH